MFRKLIHLWNNKGMEILFFSSILFLLVYAFLRRNKKGSYNLIQIKPYKKRKIIKESSGELRCRAYLENKFNKSFKKCRPNFLKNPVTGGNYNLELDCYNEEMRLAVEYNGIQHYKYTPYFHKNQEAFLNQKYRDEMKRVKCKENGIRLIEVSYETKDIENYLFKELKKLGY